ncbi:hypothetical protein C2G38_2184513 [Gigaspora rosea]|uniref:Uncharacterized protein n=1 Tax=Gigaspora rosea TaxID=44941 RepID=A0A397V7P1_9GLOM|nr:hypothetical protein C2G38_2184513 [Gigaspora rosea]
MLIRALTLKQGKELQEQIDKNFDGPLDDEQIPAALNIILEALKYIITKGEKEKDYFEWSDIETEIKKAEYKIVSEMKSEEFNQGKEKKVEDVYIELREIVDSKVQPATNLKIELQTLPTRPKAKVITRPLMREILKGGIMLEDPLIKYSRLCLQFMDEKVNEFRGIIKKKEYKGRQYEIVSKKGIEIDEDENDTSFDSMVLLKEVATKCDTLIQELVTREKKLVLEPSDLQGNGEEYKKRRIVVSNNRKYQDSNKKFDDLLKSKSEAQDIGYTNKQRLSICLL